MARQRTPVRDRPPARPSADRHGAEATTDLLRAVLALAADLDLPSLLERFVEASTQMTGARYGAINILDERGASRTFVQVGVPGAVVAALAHPPHAVGVLGRIPDEGVLRLADLTQHPAFLGWPEGHPSMGPFLGTAVRVMGETYGYLYLADKPGGFDGDDEAVVAALGAAAAVAIQNAELYAIERRRERWLTAGQRITAMLLEGAEAEDVLAAVAASAREIDGADTAVLVLPGVGGELVMEIVDGHAADELVGLRMPPGARSIEVFASGVGDVTPSSVQDRHPLPPMRQFGPALYVPLRSGGESLGVLILLRRKGARPFGAADLALSETFAAQAALAFVLAEARDAHERAGLADERARIARDLHDLAIQQLFAAGLQLEQARQGDPLPTRAAGLLDGAQRSLDASVRQIRATLRALDDASVTPLVDRLRLEVAGAAPLFPEPPRLEIRLDGRAVDAAQSEQGDVERIDAACAGRADHVLAVAREGIANAARHARASQVTLRLLVRADGPGAQVAVEVEDDGVGLPPDRSRASGTRNLAARADESAGEFSLGPAPTGRGTLLRWAAPLG